MEMYLILFKVPKLVPARLLSLTERTALDVIHLHSLISLPIYVKSALKTQHSTHQLTFVFIKSLTQTFLHKLQIFAVETLHKIQNQKLVQNKPLISTENLVLVVHLLLSLIFKV